MLAGRSRAEAKPIEAMVGPSAGPYDGRYEFGRIAALLLKPVKADVS